MENNSRKTSLINLLNLRQDFRVLREELSKFKWDCGEELVILERIHLKNVLHKYLRGELSNDDVVEWANIIEMREDIGYEVNYENLIREIIFELSNPEINYKANAAKAEKYLQVLGE